MAGSGFELGHPISRACASSPHYTMLSSSVVQRRHLWGLGSSFIRPNSFPKRQCQFRIPSILHSCYQVLFSNSYAGIHEGQDRHDLLSQSDYHIMGTQINKGSLGNMCPVLTEETLSSTRSVPVSDLVVQERESKLLRWPSKKNGVARVTWLGRSLCGSRGWEEELAEPVGWGYYGSNVGERKE